MVASAVVACVWIQAGLADDVADQLPSIESVRAAHATLRQWVDHYTAPAPDDPAARISINGAEAICITLRHNGRILGVGTDAAGDDLMLRRAAGRAMSAALGDEVIASAMKLNGQFVGSKITVELEAAGEFIPLLGRTYADFATRIDPGLDGLAVRRESETAIRFPSQLRFSGLADSPQKVLPALATDVGLPPTALTDLLKHRAGVYRFRVVHLAQAAPGDEPFEAIRGDKLVEPESVTRESILEFADGIVKHLLNRRWPDTPMIAGMDEVPPRKPLGLMGTYHPNSDRYDPLLAPPLEQALAALALAAFATLESANETIRDDARRLAVEVLGDLAETDSIEREWSDELDTNAAYVLAAAALSEPPADGRVRKRLEEAIDVLLQSVTQGDGGPAAQELTGIPPHGRAILAAAFAKLSVIAPDRADVEPLQDMLKSIWESVPEHQRATLLPWIGWAESELARTESAPIQHKKELASLRDLLHASQAAAASDESSDLVGGFRFRTQQPGIAAELIDSQSARAAVWLARVLADPELTPDMRTQGDLRHLISAMRFLQQLSVREESIWSIRNQARAIGGLRNATWDARMPAGAQAMGLLAAVEAIRALDNLGKDERN